MKTSKVIISESNRPFWQLPIAALLFTLAFATMVYSFYSTQWTYKGMKYPAGDFQQAVIIVALGVGFCSQKRVHIDVANSKFRPTLEVGPLKFGKWQTIKNPEYVSVFLQPKVNDDFAYEVNLWYDSNKHLELYERDNLIDALSIGFEISEILQIDLLDSTIPNDQKWIDKDEWKQKINERSS